MGRCKDFEHEKVLWKAMECFLEKGYQATSTRDLAQAMGISYGSVYNTFHDKRSLYLASLDLYICSFVGPLVQQLNSSTTARKTITEIFQQTVKESIDHSSNCLIGHTIVTLDNHDDEITEKIQGMQTSLEQAMEQLLQRASATGEIDSSLNLTELSQFLVHTLMSIHLTARLNQDSDKLNGIVEVALSVF
uniref:TetR/AcrR family transcriptional regulator n=1 Tax=Roseihalotalea indica TaxID=2867963 RepID=A0AA49GPX8_9BACT|nr:TetR/AcrR family transcriptional regulator [Tunicatimonas sp. TK19036]